MNTRHRYLYCIAILFLACPYSSMAAENEADRYQMGIRGGISLGDGEPSNDMPTYGLFGRYRINDQWLLGIGIDYSTYDFEDPANLLHLSTDKVYDASISQYIVSAWGEREFHTGADWIVPFVFAGIGIGVGNDDTITGNRQYGGQFSIYADPGTEVIPGIGIGARFPVADSMFIETAARFDYHFADWDVRDNISGVSSTIDDYSTFGGYLALVYTF